MGKWKKLVIGGVTAAALVTGTGTVLATNGPDQSDPDQGTVDVTVQAKRDWKRAGPPGHNWPYDRYPDSRAKPNGSGRTTVSIFWRKCYASKAGCVRVRGWAKDNKRDHKSVVALIQYQAKVNGKWKWRGPKIVARDTVGGGGSFGTRLKSLRPIRNVQAQACLMDNGAIVYASCSNWA